jgi:hypothetical protein
MMKNRATIKLPEDNTKDNVWGFRMDEYYLAITPQADKNGNWTFNKAGNLARCGDAQL